MRNYSFYCSALEGAILYLIKQVNSGSARAVPKTIVYRPPTVSGTKKKLISLCPGLGDMRLLETAYRLTNQLKTIKDGIKELAVAGAKDLRWKVSENVQQAKSN